MALEHLNSSDKSLEMSPEQNLQEHQDAGAAASLAAKLHNNTKIDATLNKSGDDHLNAKERVDNSSLANADATAQSSESSVAAANAASSAANSSNESTRGQDKAPKSSKSAQDERAKEDKMRERAATEHAGFDPQSWRQCLGFKYWLTWLSLGILALSAYIPNRLRDAICKGLAFVFYKVDIKFKRIYMANMSMVYHKMSPREHEALYREFLCHCFISFLSYGEPLFLPKWMLARRWKLKNPEVLEEAKASGRPIIFVVPHFVAIDRCGLYLSYSGLPMFAMVNSQKNKLYDWFINYQRIMFGGTIHTRNTGFRSIIRALRYGQNAYILIDEDMGPQQKFEKFCGVPKSTVDILSRLVATTNAVVLIECPTYNLKTANYELEFESFTFSKEETIEPKSTVNPEVFKDDAALAQYVESLDISKPYEQLLEKLEQDLLPQNAPYLKRLNEAQERFILKHPEQYMWFLRIFKTTPDNRYFVDIYKNVKSGDKAPDAQDRIVPTRKQLLYINNIQSPVDYEPFVKARELLSKRYQHFTQK